MKIILDDGREVSFERLANLSSGGQGKVFRGTIADKDYAFKLFDTSSRFFAREDFENNIKHNVKYNRDKHCFNDFFCWPEHMFNLLDREERVGWGYTMPLIPKGYHFLSDFLSGYTATSFKNCDAMVNAALNICKAFRKIHEEGFAYLDISCRNLAVDPENGKVLIIDNDNVTSDRNKVFVGGTDGYIAPEVLRREIDKPDECTDLHSMAVLLFKMMFLEHPLRGERVYKEILGDPEAQVRYYGKEPIYIFDEKDPFHNGCANPNKACSDQAINNANRLPYFLREVFGKVFSHQIMTDVGHMYKRRKVELKWQHYLMRLKSSIITCPYCQKDRFIDHEHRTTCKHCGNTREMRADACLKFFPRDLCDVVLPIADGIRLFEYHSNTHNHGSHEKVIASIHKKEDIFYIENRSGDSWRINREGHEVEELSSGSSVELSENLQIFFSADPQSLATVLVS